LIWRRTQRRCAELSRRSLLISRMTTRHASETDTASRPGKQLSRMRSMASMTAAVIMREQIHVAAMPIKPSQMATRWPTSILRMNQRRAATNLLTKDEGPAHRGQHRQAAGAKAEVKYCSACRILRWFPNRRREMFLPSKEADLALAELTARRDLDVANRTGDIKLIRQKTLALASAERARREGR
jgi:hypothetical protein